MIIALTGKDGFVGKSLYSSLSELAQLVEVRAQDGQSKYRLNQPSNIDSIQPDLLIHCALTRKRYKRVEHDLNYLGMKRILAETRNNPKIRIIYLSSLSSHSYSLSQYGKSKFEIEKLLSEFSNVYVLRAGIICAIPCGGFERILKKIANTPLVMISISKLVLWITPMSMLLNSISSIVNNSLKPNVSKIIIAEREPMSLTNFLKSHRSRFTLLTIELSLVKLFRLIDFIEQKFHLELALFDSIKSYMTPLEQRDYHWGL